MAYSGNSIVDYLKSVGQDSSYSSRAVLAAKNGISNYTGSIEQNTKLLNLLNKPASTPVSTPITPKATAYDTTSKYIQDPFNAGASIPNPNYVAPKTTPVVTAAPTYVAPEKQQPTYVTKTAPVTTPAPIVTPATVTPVTPATTPVTPAPIVTPVITPQVTNNEALLKSVREEQQKRIDHPELYDASGKLKIVEAPEVKDISLNVPPTNITIPTLTTPTSVESNSSLITSLSTQLTQANTALQTAYQTQIDKINADKTAIQAKIDEITAKEESTLGDVKELTKPFRDKLEETERERLYVNENFEANQTLTNELDGLLTEGNSLISQLKGVTGLASIRNPRVNEAIDAVNARAGVISAVMTARNNQINQAYTMIDRTTAAITADKNDQLAYYNAILSFYDSAKTTEGTKLISLNADEKTYINAKIANLESSVASIEKTSEAIKAALINPTTALLYAKAGITLNDSIEEINSKLAKQTYASEVINTANTMSLNGYIQYAAGASIPSGYESTTTYDSQGVGTTWIKKISKDSDENIGKTVTVDKKVYQYNPNTGLYDIPVGSTTENVVNVENQLISAQSDIDTIKNILNSDLPAVGPNLIARFDPMTWFTGTTQKFIGQVEQIVNSETLNAFIEAKKNGATFGSMTEGEWLILSSAATKIGTWKIKDKDGKTIGYDIDQQTFRDEMSSLLRVVEKAKKDLASQKISSNAKVQYNPDGTVKDLNF